jgi:S1-C subfamily serine protease
MAIRIFHMLVMLAVPAAGDVADKPIPAVFADAAPAVVKIYGASLGRQQGYGTGTLVSADGLILTQYSILLTSSSIRVVLQDGRRFDAKLVREDDARKLALIKIDADGLTFLTPTASDGVMLGDTVLGLGNWFKIAEGQEPVSLTRGMFSIKTRVDTRRLAQEYEYQGPVLVYDAITANPGAAGGPLLDHNGHFIGLIGTIVESAYTNTRINYAVPGEDLIAFLGSEKSVPIAANSDAPQALGTKTHSSAGRADFGIVLSKLGHRQVSAFVEKVRKDSPAAKAGIKTDDLIMVIDGHRIGSTEDYQKTMALLIPGQRVQVILKRGEQVLTMDVVVGSHP